jgi:hypothetical protein
LEQIPVRTNWEPIAVACSGHDDKIKFRQSWILDNQQKQIYFVVLLPDSLRVFVLVSLSMSISVSPYVGCGDN